MLHHSTTAASTRIRGAALIALTIGALATSCGDKETGRRASRDDAKGGTSGASSQGKGGSGVANDGGTSGSVGGSGTPGTAGSDGLAGNDGFGDQPAASGGGQAGDGGQPGSSDGGQPGGSDGGAVHSGGSAGAVHSGGTAGSPSGSPSNYVCAPACGAGQICCPIGVRTECVPSDADGCNVPDLTVTESETVDTLGIAFINADQDPCLQEEACVTGPGVRRVLVFNAGTPNIGSGDLVVGAPSPGNQDFEYSGCHGHYHFAGYASYELLDESGNVAARGHKQSYCMRDEERVLDEPGVSPNRVYYDCTGGLQGISRGWSDVYKVGLDCQWVDITGVPAGDYFLRVRANPDRRIYELDYDNNEITVPVTIPP